MKIIGSESRRIIKIWSIRNITKLTRRIIGI